MRHKQRRREAILFTRDDWQLFLDPATLPQRGFARVFRQRVAAEDEAFERVLANVAAPLRARLRQGGRLRLSASTHWRDG